VGAGVRAADYDEAGNLWAAGDNGTLYVKLNNSSSFRGYTVGDGLHAQQYGLNTLAGGAGGEVFVGYVGCDDTVSPFDQNCRNYGDVDRVHLRSDGTLDVYHYELHNTYAPTYDETRTIWRILYAHSGPARGQVFVGSQHGIARLDGTGYRDHVHGMCRDSNDTLVVSGNHAGLALDANGDLWFGGAFLGALWQFQSDPMRWLEDDGGNYVGAPSNPIERRVFLQDQPCDLSRMDSTMGIAVLPDGRAFFASKTHGVAVWSPGNLVAQVMSTTGLPSAELTDIAPAADGNLWIATEGAGMVEMEPNTGHVTGSLGGLPSGHVTHLIMTDWAGANVLVISTWRGVATLR
jgi:ligand-binding sensor domain-containing protein